MAGTPENVDRLAERSRVANIALELEPTDMPWGMREMLAIDPDGNFIVVGGMLG